MKRKIINIILTLIIGLIYYYILIPPINLSSPAFWVFIVFLLIIFGLLQMGSNIVELVNTRRFKFKWNALFIVPIIIVLITIVNFFSSPLFASSKYANRITIDEMGNFTEDIPLVDFNKVPLLDKDSSQKLGDRVMGEMSEWVSQYYVSDLYTQINYDDSIVRVTPLEYADLIKYFANRRDGIKGYITVNSVTGEAKLEKLENGMKYVPSAILNEDMLRHLRFIYPTAIFGDYSFELDENGSPYYIVPTIKYSLVGLRPDISGIIVLNPITGESTRYTTGEVPDWIDNVYNARLIIEQTDDWGIYKNGFFNSIFAQKNVTNTTDGYNYLAYDNDIYLYTGITSVQNDESNLGFILSNLRTKETVFYSMPGAEEYSAMASAEGQVQEMSYNSTFPLLINLNNRATYLVSLKDNAGLVKKYAFIDVQDYQKVYVADVNGGIEAASKSYIETFNLSSNVVQSKIITIKSITPVVIDSSTTYYIEDTNGNRYTASINVAKNTLPFISVQDKIEITYQEGTVNIIKSIN